MLNKIIFVSILGVLAITPFIAQGATFKTGQSYYLEPGGILDDNLYAVGGNVVVTGTVNGDLLAAGGNIAVSGPVFGSVSVVGGSLNISSDVLGSVRSVGESINVSNSVGGDFVAAGGQINVMPGSTFGKDVAIAGGTVYIDGTINGNLQVTSPNIKLGPNAVVMGTFDYYSDSPAILEQGAAVQGATNFHETKIPEKSHVSKGFIGIFSLVKAIMIFVTALVMLYFFKSQVNPIIEKSVSGFWKEALRGFIVLIVVPVAVILSFITVIGAFFGFIVMLLYGVFLIISSVISVLLFARLSLKYLFKKESYQLNWWIVAISSVAFGLIAVVPFVGWIFVFVIFISTLGSTSDFIYKKLIA